MRKKVLGQVLIAFPWVLAQTAPAFAQTKSISGIISDQSATPLEKATIQVKGGKFSVFSDANGSFKLAVPEGATRLEVSYVRMTPVEVTIEGKQSVLVTLNVTDSKLKIPADFIAGDYSRLDFKLDAGVAIPKTVYFDDIIMVK